MGRRQERTRDAKRKEEHLHPIAMVRSMTGFGRAQVELDDKKLTVEIKSLNGKQMDLSTRIPSLLREKEL